MENNSASPEESLFNDKIRLALVIPTLYFQMVEYYNKLKFFINSNYIKKEKVNEDVHFLKCLMYIFGIYDILEFDIENKSLKYKDEYTDLMLLNNKYEDITSLKKIEYQELKKGYKAIRKFVYVLGYLDVKRDAEKLSWDEIPI